MVPDWVGSCNEEDGGGVEGGVISDSIPGFSLLQLVVIAKQKIVTIIFMDVFIWIQIKIIF